MLVLLTLGMLTLLTLDKYLMREQYENGAKTWARLQSTLFCRAEKVIDHKFFRI